jgi:hypothetical protein
VITSVDTSADDLTVGPKDDADGGIGNGDNDNSNVKTPATDLTTAPATNDTDPTENDADENPSKDNPVSDEKLTLSLKKNEKESSDDSLRLPN